MPGSNEQQPTETTRCRHGEVQSTSKRWGSLWFFFLYRTSRARSVQRMRCSDENRAHRMSVFDRWATKRKNKCSQRMEKVVAFAPPHSPHTHKINLTSFLQWIQCKNRTEYAVEWVPLIFFIQFDGGTLGYCLTGWLVQDHKIALGNSPTYVEIDQLVKCDRSGD